MRGKSWVITLLLVSACGGGAGSGTTGTATGPPTTAAPTTSAAPTTTSTSTVPGEVVVDADDGSARLRIPADAFGPGIDVSPIAVNAVEGDGPALAVLTDSGLSLLGVYELSPTGISFDTPALLEVPAPDDGALVSAFLVTDDGLEPLTPLPQATPDGDLAFEVPHFSVVATVVGAYRLTTTAPNDVLVDLPFALLFDLVLGPEAPAITGFAVQGTVIADEAIEPSLVLEPVRTTVQGSAFSTTIALTCRDQGTWGVRQFAVVNVAHSQLPAVLQEWQDPDTPIQWAGETKHSVTCETTETSTQRIAGAYGGPLTVTPAPGTTGAPYTDEFELILQDCGTATVIQRGAQQSEGFFWFFGREEPIEVVVVVRGEGEGYREAYRLLVDVGGPDPVQVFGHNGGGGHGFGEVPAQPHLDSAILDFAERGEPPPEPLGWLGTVEGSMDRTGDAPPCD